MALAPVLKEGSFTNSREQKLYTLECLPADGQVQGVLFWNHGYGEYVDRYRPLFVTLTGLHLAVHGYDMHGHGMSQPKENRPVFLARFQDMIDDAVQAFDLVRSKYPAGTPIYVAGQSLGGLVVAHLVTKRQEHIAGLMLQSAAIDVEWTTVLKIQAAVGDLLSCLVPRAQIVPAVRLEDMSQDPVVVKEYLEDPLIEKGNVRVRTANEINKGFKAIARAAPSIKVPIYAAHGTSDRCTSLPAVKRFLASVASKDKQLVEVPGGYHELLWGPEKEQAISSLLGWLQQHLRGGHDPSVHAAAEAAFAATQTSEAAAAAGKVAGAAAPEDVKVQAEVEGKA